MFGLKIWLSPCSPGDSEPDIVSNKCGNYDLRAVQVVGLPNWKTNAIAHNGFYRVGSRRRKSLLIHQLSIFTQHT